MHSTLKKFFLGFFLVAISTLFWLFIRSVLFQNPGEVSEHFWSLRNVGIFSALFVLYGVLLSLVTFVMSERIWAQSIVFFGIAPYVLVAPRESWEFIGAFAVLWASVVLMREQVWKENANRIQLSIDRAITPNLTWVFTALAFAVSVAFYVSPAVLQLKDIRIPREVFAKLVSPAERVFEQGSQFSVQNFLGTLEHPAPLTDEQKNALPPEEQSALQRMIRPFTEPPKPNAMFSEFTDALYNAFNNRIASIDSLSPATTKVLALTLATALFTSIRLMAIPLGWIVIVLSMIVFNVLTYTGFVKIGTVQVEKETIEL